MAVKKAVTTADVKAAEATTEGYVKLTSPTGSVTEVPESIADILIESGYSK